MYLLQNIPGISGGYNGDGVALEYIIMVHIHTVTLLLQMRPAPMQGGDTFIKEMKLTAYSHDMTRHMY